MKDKAKKKLNAKIKKDIKLTIELAKQCTTAELLFLMYVLHWSRLTYLFVDNDFEQSNAAKIINKNAINEALKYAISLVLKYGSINKEVDYSKFNLELTNLISSRCTKINSLYEVNGLIELYNVEVSGESDQNLKIIDPKYEEDTDEYKLIAYYKRVEIDNDFDKDAVSEGKLLLKTFVKEHQSSNELFKLALGVSVPDFSKFIEFLLSLNSSCLEKIKEKCTRLENENIEVLDSITFKYFSKCYIIDKTDMSFNEHQEYSGLLKKLTFDSTYFDEEQLRFHQLIRQPIIEVEDAYIISPELLIDSIFTNTHYSLLIY